MNEALKIEPLHDSGVKIPVRMRDGTEKHVELSLAAYAAAANNGMTLSGFLELTNPGYDEKYGTVFEQMCSRAGILTRSDAVTGMASTTFKQLDQGTNLMNNMFPGMSTIVKPDSANGSIAGRLLVPEIILQIIRSNLSESNDDFFMGIDRMVALTENVSGDKVDQPMIDLTAPEASAGGRIAQLGEPKIMVSITTSDKSHRIPTIAIGAQISEQAQGVATLDLVSLAVTAQARGERLRHYENYLSSMINGDVDMGETAVASELVTAYDSTIATAGTISHKAFMKWLRNSYRKRSVNYLMMDMDTAMAVEGRSGRPNQQTDNPNSPRMNVDERVMNLNVQVPNVLIVDSSIVGANTIVGIDSRFAIRRIRNVSASYQAIEQNVIRRATSLRIDYGEIMHKLFPDAWQKVVLATS